MVTWEVRAARVWMSWVVVSDVVLQKGGGRLAAWDIVGPVLRGGGLEVAWFGASKDSDARSSSAVSEISRLGKPSSGSW